MPLVSLDDAKVQFQISSSAHDQALEAYIDAVDAIVEEHRGELVTSQSATTTLLIDTWTDTLVIPARPLTAVTSVAAADGSRTYDITNAVVRTSGVVFLPYQRICGPTTVAYTAGWVTPPANYQKAALMILQHLWSNRKNTTSAPSGGMVDTMHRGEAGYAIPNAALELLGRRSPAVA